MAIVLRHKHYSLLCCLILCTCLFVGSLADVQGSVLYIDSVKLRENRANALLALSKAEETARKLTHRYDYASTLALIGRGRAVLSDTQGATRLFDEVEELLADPRVELVYSPHLLVDGYLALHRIDSALQIAEKYDRHGELYARIAKTLVIQDQLAAAEKVCLKIETARIYQPLGMLACAYYKKGRQKDVERLFQFIPKKGEATCIFYRDTFAAQARWEMESGKKSNASTLLNIAQYWQVGYEKLQETEYQKENERWRWAKQQARAGDIKGCVATVSLFPPPGQLPTMILNTDPTWQDYTILASNLVGAVEPERVPELLNSSLASKPLPESARVVGLVDAALMAESLRKKKDAQSLWKAANRNIKNEQKHAFITLGLVHARMDQLEPDHHHADLSHKYFLKAATQLEHYWQNTNAIGNEASLLTYLEHLIHAQAFDQVEMFLRAYLRYACTEMTFLDRQEGDKPRILFPGFQFMQAIDMLIEAKPEWSQKMMQFAEQAKDPEVRVQIYLGIASGLAPNRPPTPGMLYRDSFSMYK